jgi:hypothetical protein
MQGWPPRALLRVGAALSFLLASLPLLAQNAATGEYRAKANYLANFPSFVEWPQEAWSQGKTSFLVCVFGEFSFGTSWLGPQPLRCFRWPRTPRWKMKEL